MKKFLLALVLFSSSCVNATFVKGVDSGVAVIGPEYEAYVRADSTISQKTKDIRLKTLQSLIDLINEAKK